MKRIIILLVTISCLLVSCEQHDKVQDSNEPFMVKLADSSLLDVIDQFISEVEVKPDSSYLVLDIYTMGSREVIYISFNETIYPDSNPSALSYLNGHLILINSELNRYVKTNIKQAVDYYIEKYAIKLEPYDMEFLSHPQRWKLTRCESGMFDIDKYPSTLRRDYVPCSFNLDSNNNTLKQIVKPE